MRFCRIFQFFPDFSIQEVADTSTALVASMALRKGTGTSSSCGSCPQGGSHLWACGWPFRLDQPCSHNILFVLRRGQIKKHLFFFCRKHSYAGGQKAPRNFNAQLVYLFCSHLPVLGASCPCGDTAVCAGTCVMSGHVALGQLQKRC